MKFTLDKPDAVKEAAAAQKGMNAFGEVGVFILVFLTAVFAEGILMVPIFLVMAFGNPELMGDLLGVSFVAEEEKMSFEWSLSDFASGGQESLSITLVALFSTLAMIGTVILFCKVFQKRDMTTLGFVRKRAGKEYLEGLVLGFVMLSAAVLICILTGSLSFDGLSENFALGILLLFIVGFLIQGMAEEVMMRGYFLVSFARRHSIWAAVIANSVLFTMLHLFNSGISLLAIINLTLYGVFASIYFVKSGNIWGVGALHFMWNLVQGNFYGIQVSGTEVACSVFSSTLTEGREIINGGAFGLEGGLAVTIVLLLGILFVYWRYQAVEKN